MARTERSLEPRACPVCEGATGEEECGWLDASGDGTCEAYDA